MEIDKSIIDDSAIEVYAIAEAYAKDSLSPAIEPAHLFKALLHKEVGLVAFIEKTLKQDYYYLVDWADMRIKMGKKSVGKAGTLALSPLSKAVFQEADTIRSARKSDKIDAQCLLASIVTPGVGFTFEQLKTMPLQKEDVLAGSTATKTGRLVAGEATASNPKNTISQYKHLAKYCLLKNQEALEGKWDTIVGFEKELAEMYEILGRKTKSNILLTGESGVGKTALIQAFVRRTVDGHVPSFLENASVYELDLTALSMDISYKGEIESRMKKVFEELSTLGNAILVIESLDKMMDKQGILYSTVGLLKSYLNQGLLTLCTSSIEGYTKHIETDKELAGKFEHILIEEPTPEQAKRILDGIIPGFETYHGLPLETDVSESAIRLAKRYFSEKHLPDSAIDLIDRTMAFIKTTNDIAGKDIQTIRGKFERWRQTAQPEEAKKEALKWIYYEMTNGVSPLLTARLDLETEPASLPTLQAQEDWMEAQLKQLEAMTDRKIEKVEAHHLSAVVAQKTGIPMGNIQTKEREKLVNAEATLKKRVVGQDHAIKIVLDSIYESRSGLNKKGQPMGSFFFLGPTGTGKTELAKSLAEFLFQDETAMLRFDMSEYKEEHSVALLYGAPPGYVGYEEGGLLVNQIRQKPYSVVLFDEIEKAHRSVFDLFLQILDEGKLHDRLGRVGDFSNALILFTSNIGSDYIFNSFGNGIVPTHNQMLEVMQGHFRPEFLARLTEIVPFSPITEKIVRMIFEIHLKGLLKTLAEQQITLEIDEKARQTIAMSGFHPQYGARPILGIIRKDIRRPLSKMIISGEIKPGSAVKLKCDENNRFQWDVHSPETA